MNRLESSSERTGAPERSPRGRLSPPPRVPTTSAPRRRRDRGRGSGLLGFSLLAGLGAVALFVIFGLPRVAERATVSAGENVSDRGVAPASAGVPAEAPPDGLTDLEQSDGPQPPEGLPSLQEAEGDSPGLERERAVDGELTRARAALAAGDAYAAQRAYQRVLQLEPAHPEALQGLARAERLDRVRGLLAEAEAAEQGGRLEEARGRYREALQLDASSSPARQGLARLDASSASEQFRSAVSGALRALDRGSLEDARTAIERAASLRPQAPEVADLRQRVEREEQARRVRGLEERARLAEQEERWEAAVEAWTELAEIDPTLTGARSGRARSRERAALDLRLGRYLERPDRLTESAVWEEARDALAAAREVAEPGPRLRTQIEELGRWVETMSVTVPVVLVSDGETEVTVYRVGRLGAFERRQLDLRPGSYTVLGTREGFRDVRRQLVVAPGEPVSLDVRCQERVG